MSFRVRFPNAEHFADMLKAVSVVVDEGTFTIDEKSMKIVSMDPAHISLVDFELESSAAEEYVCTQATNMTVNITELLKFLKRAKKSESLILNYEADKKRLMVTLVDNVNLKERSFTMNTLEPISSRTGVPNLIFDGKVRLDVDVVVDAIEDSSVVSDYIKIAISPDGVTMTAKGELGTVQTKLLKDSPAVREIKAEREVYANFSIDYMEKIVKAGKSLADNVIMELSTNKPIRLEFPIESGRLSYLIAPRIEAA